MKATGALLILSVVTAAACAASIPANRVFGAGHDSEIKAQLAQAHYAACLDAGATSCPELQQDLTDIIETSRSLQEAALDAGYKK
ncbi:MAG TPA: hypothetical protein VI299_28915 [Polyangiales bacterium]